MLHTKEADKERIATSKNFILWLFIVSIVMLFASLTSAYIVKKADGGWFKFPLPIEFTISTVVIVLSSISMQLAVVFDKKKNLILEQTMMAITVVLGIVFLWMQVQGWHQLPVEFGGVKSNDSGNFLYVLSGAHGAHIISGLVYLLIVFGRLLTIKDSSKGVGIMNCATFWHFLGLLWIYLFIFLKLNHQL